MPWYWPCGKDKPAPLPVATSLLDPAIWSILYSPGMPLQPSARAGGGWFFDFPSAPGSVHYVTAAINRPIGGGLSIGGGLAFQAEIETNDDAVFDAKIADDNQAEGGMPPHCRLFFQRAGDDFTNPLFRWWSNPGMMALQRGTFGLAVSLAPDQWSSVQGARGTDAPAEFSAAMADCANVGLTFGGGSFFGHGVTLRAGSARFNLLAFA